MLIILPEGMLEDCGLVRTAKRGRVRIVELRPRTLREAEGWLARQLAMWEKRFDQLDDYVLGLPKAERPRGGRAGGRR